MQAIKTVFSPLVLAALTLSLTACVLLHIPTNQLIRWLQLSWARLLPGTQFREQRITLAVPPLDDSMKRMVIYTPDRPSRFGIILGSICPKMSGSATNCRATTVRTDGTE